MTMKIKVTEKRVSESKSGEVEINSGFSAYYEQRPGEILLEVTLIDKGGAARTTGTALISAPFNSQTVSDTLLYAAEKAIHVFISNELQSPSKDGGKSAALVADQLRESSRALGFERHFNGAAAHILIDLGLEKG